MRCSLAEKGKTMANTMWFIQCEDCEHCTEAVIGYCSEKHQIFIDNPKTDGCTWGNPKEDAND